MNEAILAIPILLFSVVIHEFAHAWQAKREGDDTAQELGRLTLNPIPHIDIIGTVVLPTALAVMHLPILGWAKPVPVNPQNFRNYRAGDIRVSLAGIVSNLLLAFCLTIGIGLLIHANRAMPSGNSIIEVVQRVAFYGLQINFLLAVFNLLPVPPLDGSHVMYHLLPPQLGLRYRQFGQYGMLILYGLLFFGFFRYLQIPVLFLMNLASDFIALWT